MHQRVCVGAGNAEYGGYVLSAERQRQLIVRSISWCQANLLSDSGWYVRLLGLLAKTNFSKLGIGVPPMQIFDFLLGNIPNPLTRPRKLRIVRLAASGKAHSLRCSSFPPHNPLRWACAGSPFRGCATFRCLLLVSQIYLPK